MWRREDRCRTASIAIAVASAVIAASGLALAQDSDKQTCLQLSDPDRSIPACTRIIDSKPQNQAELADTYLFRASAYRDKKQMDAALRDLEEYLDGRIAHYGVHHEATGTIMVVMRDRARAVLAALKGGA